MKRNLLNPAQASWLADTFARNRSAYAGWSMEGPDDKPKPDDKKVDDKPEDKKPDPDKKVDDKPEDKGYPEGKKVEDMTPVEQSAYWAAYARTHEERNKALLKITGGLYGEDLKKKMDELEELRQSKLTDGEKAVEQAKIAARSETVKDVGASAARVAVEFAVGHDPETNDLSAVLDLLDLSKVLTDEGKVDAVKVRALAAQIAPAGKGGAGPVDYGGGRRTTSQGGAKSVQQVMADRRAQRAERNASSTS